MSHHLTYYTFNILDDKNSTSNKNVKKNPKRNSSFSLRVFFNVIKIIRKIIDNCLSSDRMIYLILTFIKYLKKSFILVFQFEFSNCK